MTATSAPDARSWQTSATTSRCCALTAAASARSLSTTTGWSRWMRDERSEDGLERPGTRAARRPAVGVMPSEGLQGESADVEAVLHATALHVVRDRSQELIEGDRVHLSEREGDEIHQI